MPDSELLLHEILGQIKDLRQRVDGLCEDVARLNGLPQRVRSLEQWRAGIAAVGSAIVVAIGVTIAWIRGGN